MIKLNLSHKKPQKKLISLQHYTLIDGLLKDESAITGSSEAAIAEDALLSRYLGTMDNAFATIIANNLYQSGGISMTCAMLYRHLATISDYTSDDVLALIDLCHQIELRHRTAINSKDKSAELSDLLSSCQSIKAYLDKAIRVGDRYTQPSGGTDIYYGCQLIRDIINDISKGSDDIGLYFLPLMSDISNMWYVGGMPGTGDGGLKNLPETYDLLASVCDLCEWPDYPEYRLQLLNTVSKIHLSTDRHHVQTTNTQTLLPVFLSKKSFEASEGSILLFADDNAKKIIISGNNVQYQEYPYTQAALIKPYPNETDVPVIMLHNGDLNTAEKSAEQIAPKLCPEYFGSINPKAICLVQIMFGGTYADPRVRWTTV